jgi:hypothetical protein
LWESGHQATRHDLPHGSLSTNPQLDLAFHANGQQVSGPTKTPRVIKKAGRL